MINTRIVFVTALLVILTACTDKNFDSHKWKTWTENEGGYTLRWDMTDDLIDNYLLIGMTKVDVINLLGEPMDNCNKPSCVIIYGLGPCRSGISYGSLYLTLEDNKIVEIYKHCG